MTCYGLDVSCTCTHVIFSNSFRDFSKAFLCNCCQDLMVIALVSETLKRERIRSIMQEINAKNWEFVDGIDGKKLEKKSGRVTRKAGGVVHVSWTDGGDVRRGRALGHSLGLGRFSMVGLAFPPSPPSRPCPRVCNIRKFPNLRPKCRTFRARVPKSTAAAWGDDGLASDIPPWALKLLSRDPEVQSLQKQLDSALMEDIDPIEEVDYSNMPPLPAPVAPRFHVAREYKYGFCHVHAKALKPAVAYSGRHAGRVVCRCPHFYFPTDNNGRSWNTEDHSQRTTHCLQTSLGGWRNKSQTVRRSSIATQSGHKRFFWRCRIVFRSCETRVQQTQTWFTCCCG